MKLRSAVLALAFVTIGSTAQAQTGNWWLGLGMSTPMGDAGDAFKSGFLGTAGIGFDLKSMPGWAIQVEGLMAKHDAKVGSGDMSMLGALANVLYDVNPTSNMSPYVYGGLGMMSSKASGGSSVSDMAWQAGAGLSWKAGSVARIWAEVRWLSVMSDPSTNFMPITAGFSMPFGSK
jgi:opacity protein-like surface antigen